jgi:hypothetical protein
MVNFLLFGPYGGGVGLLGGYGGGMEGGRLAIRECWCLQGGSLTEFLPLVMPDAAAYRSQKQKTLKCGSTRISARGQLGVLGHSRSNNRWSGTWGIVPKEPTGLFNCCAGELNLLRLHLPRRPPTWLSKLLVNCLNKAVGHDRTPMTQIAYRDTVYNH